jgi:hypothetical protein
VQETGIVRIKRSTRRVDITIENMGLQDIARRNDGEKTDRMTNQNDKNADRQ